VHHSIYSSARSSTLCDKAKSGRSPALPATGRRFIE
jgi:hypothetical protein